MKGISCQLHTNHRAFSLAEVLAALTIGAMVLVAVLGIYSRAQSSAASITRKLNSSRFPGEVLQLIAEDLDRIITSGSGVKITIANKFEKGYPKAKLTIQQIIKDDNGRPQVFEEIIWQAGFDYESDVDGMVLFRSHRGIVPEDKLLDEQRESWEKDYSLVPICAGVTFFKIQVPRGESFLDAWSSNSLPPGITVTISFAEPFKRVTGTLDVPPEDKITRTIAIDRTRKIRFIFVPQELTEKANAVNTAPDAKATGITPPGQAAQPTGTSKARPAMSNRSTGRRKTPDKK